MYYCQELEIFSLKRTSNYNFINIYAHSIGKFDTWIVTRIIIKNPCNEMWHEMITVEIRWDISVIPQSATKAKNLWKDFKKKPLLSAEFVEDGSGTLSFSFSFCHSWIGLEEQRDWEDCHQWGWRFGDGSQLVNLILVLE